MAKDTSPTPKTPDVAAALSELRGTVAQLIGEGIDPSEVLELGTLVARCAPEGTDLGHLRDTLANSTLPEVVGEVAHSIQAREEEEEEEGDEDRFSDEEASPGAGD